MLQRRTSKALASDSMKKAWKPLPKNHVRLRWHVESEQKAGEKKTCWKRYTQNMIHMYFCTRKKSNNRGAKKDIEWICLGVEVTGCGTSISLGLHSRVVLSGMLVNEPQFVIMSSYFGFVVGSLSIMHTISLRKILKPQICIFRGKGRLSH